MMRVISQNNQSVKFAISSRSGLYENEIPNTSPDLAIDAFKNASILPTDIHQVGNVKYLRGGGIDFRNFYGEYEVAVIKEYANGTQDDRRQAASENVMYT